VINGEIIYHAAARSGRINCENIEFRGRNDDVVVARGRDGG